MAQSNFPALTVQQVQTAYLAFFNRPADSAGLAYWTSDQHKGGLPGMWSSFGLVPEFTTTFGNKPATEIVETFYVNMFGRPSDAAGKTYWLAELSAGRVDIGNLAAAFDAGAAPADKTILSGKVVANTATTQAAIDAVLPGTTFLLTTGVDKGAAFTGTGKMDTFTSVVDSLNSLNTLNAKDEIDGGAGKDTLTVGMGTNFNGFADGGFLKNVETVNLTSNSVAARDFSFTGVTGVETINIEVPADKAPINLTNLNFIPVAVNVKGLAATSDTQFTVGFKDADVTKGTADVLTLGVTDSGKIDNPATTANEAKILTLNAAGIEAVTLNAAGTNNVSLNVAAAKSLAITGSGDLVLAGGFAAVKTIDALAFTGKSTIDLAAATDLTSVLLGSGNDTVTINAGDVTGNATINGGAGDDRVNLLAVTASSQLKMSGVETLGLGVGTQTIFSATDTTGLQKVVLANGLVTGNTIANLGGISLGIDVEGTSTTNTQVFDHAGATTVNVKKHAAAAAADTTTSAANLTLTQSSDLALTVADKTTYTGTIQAVKAGTVALKIDGTVTGATISAGVANSVVISAVAKDSTITAGNFAEAKSIALTANGGTFTFTALNAGKAENFSSTAGKSVTLTAGGDLGKVQTVNINQSAGTFAGNSHFAGLNVANLTGAGIVNLANVGSATQEYSLNVNSTINGALTLGTVTTKSGNIAINATNALGAVAVGIIDAKSTATTAGDVTLNVSSSLAAVAQTGSLTGRDVTVNANGNLSTVKIADTGTLTGRDVTLNVEAVGSNAVTVGAITAARSVTINGPSLSSINTEANAVAITHAANSTGLTVALKGGSLIDKFTITGVATSTNITVTGDLGGGVDEVTVTGAAGTGKQTISVAGLKAYDKAILTGGANGDTIVFGAGADTFVYAASGITAFVTEIGTNFSDTILDFTKGTDSISFNNGAITAVATTGTFAFNDIAATNSKLLDTKINFIDIGAQTLDLSVAANVATVLAAGGITVEATAVATTGGDAMDDIIFGITNGTDTFVYLYNGSADSGATGANATIDASEIVLITKLVGVNDMVAGDFIIA